MYLCHVVAFGAMTCGAVQCHALFRQTRKRPLLSPTYNSVDFNFSLTFCWKYAKNSLELNITYLGYDMRVAPSSVCFGNFLCVAWKTLLCHCWKLEILFESAPWILNPQRRDVADTFILIQTLCIIGLGCTPCKFVEISAFVVIIFYCHC